MDELLNKVAFIYPCAYIARYDVMAYSYRVRASLHPLHCIWTPHPRWWMGYVGRMRNRPIKVINGSTRTPGRPRAACLRPNLSLKKDFFVFLFTSPRCFERLLVSVFVIVDITEYRLFTEMYITRTAIWFRFICVCGVLFFMDCPYKETWCKNCE